MKTLQQLFDEILKQTDGNYQEALNLLTEVDSEVNQALEEFIINAAIFGANEDTLDNLWTIFESKLGD